MMKRPVLMLLCITPLCGISSQAAISPAEARPLDELARSFQQPPDSAKTGIFWFWINGNITREGITADLEAMARVGIKTATIFETSGNLPGGPVTFLSTEWRTLFKHALAEADNRLMLHCYTHQPWLDRAPGMTMEGWGTHFDRTETWWEQSKAWHDYIARCQYLLQSGFLLFDLLEILLRDFLSLVSTQQYSKLAA